MKKIAITGSAFSVGEQLGLLGREAWHKKLTAIPLWKTVTALQTSGTMAAMRAAVIEHYPLIWQELEGMAQGLNAPVDEVFAWNCRGDLVRSTSDGCTTLAGCTANGDLLIAHNEDGFPQLREDCALVSIVPDEGLAFTSFVYPGSIAGHTFAVNEKGIVNTVNNIRALHRPSGLPRQVMARAALNASTLDEAVHCLTSNVRAGAFHHTLGQMDDNRLLSVEATGSGYSVLQLTETMGHANHLIHPGMADVKQVVTESSAARQAMLKTLLTDCLTLSMDNAKTILSDHRDEELPVYRLSPEDPDDENTLATAIFVLSAYQVEWHVFGSDREKALVKGSLC